MSTAGSTDDRSRLSVSQSDGCLCREATRGGHEIATPLRTSWTFGPQVRGRVRATREPTSLDQPKSSGVYRTEAANGKQGCAERTGLQGSHKATKMSHWISVIVHFVYGADAPSRGHARRR